jgi:hypothetical protein
VCNDKSLSKLKCADCYDKYFDEASSSRGIWCKGHIRSTRENGGVSEFVFRILNNGYIGGRMEVTERIYVMQERDCIRI